MSKSPIESHMPKPKKDIQRPSGSESPEVQHVEMASGPGAGSHSNPIDLSDECQLYSRTPLPSRTLANARAALQQLVLRSRYGSSYIFEGCGSHDSINLPQPPPARVVGQSGVSSPRRSSSHSAGFDVRCAQEHALPEISFGANAPMPRWRIEHIHPLLARGSPTLRWVFDSGTDFAQFGWSEDMIYEYAYRWLEEALNDPSFGLSTRSNILDGHGEDPLPTLPPAPSTCYFQRWSQSSRTSDNWYTHPDYESLRMAWPIGTQSQFQFYFSFNSQHQHFSKDKADASEAPKQPSRTEQPFSGYHGIHNNYMFDFESSEGCNETDLELGRHKSTQMSGEATMDENQSMQFNGYRWVWFSIAFLVLSMFLCLFLYAFRIIK